MNNLSSLQKKDLKYIFHPCSQMKDYEELPPIIIKKQREFILKMKMEKIYGLCFKLVGKSFWSLQ